MAKLTSKIAAEMVDRIEALQKQVEDVYAEARGHDGGHSNETSLKEVVKYRAAVREEQYMADAVLAGFDVEDE